MKKVYFYFSVFLLFLFTACNMDVDDIQRSTKLEYIKLDTSTAKIEYSEGEKFSTAGIKVFGYYSDNTVKEEDQKYIEYSGFPEIENYEDIEKNVDVPITVSYGGFTDIYNIKFIDEKAIGIEVQVKKQVYVLYEEIENDVLIVNLVYDNGRRVVLERDQYTISTNFHTQEVDENKIITVKYKDFTATFVIAVYANNVTKLLISSPPDKCKYTLKEKLDLTGMVVMATFGTNAEYYRPISSNVYNILVLNEDDQSFDIENFENLPAGKYKLRIYIGDIQANDINLEILEAYQTGIALKPEPETPYKLIYNKGEVFKLENYKFVQVLSNNEYGPEIPLEQLSCTQDGKEFDTDNQKNTITVTSEFHNLLTDKDETAEYSFEVFVTQANLVRITARLDLAPAPLPIPLGLLPDANNNYFKWIITGILSDGNTISIPAASCKFEYENEKLKTREFTEIKEELKNSESGTVKQNVCISYYDSNICKYLSCTGEVSVTKPIVKDVRITKFPKTQYVAGESFNPYGMIVTAYTSDDGSDSYEYKENSPYFSYSSNPLNTGDIPFDIKFRLYGEDYTFQLIIKVTENKIASLVIEPKKKGGPTYIRLGENYTKNDYLRIYDVKKKYMNGEVSEQPITGQDVDYLQIFTQKSDYPSPPDIFYGKVCAVYNDISSQITVNGEYKETSSNPLMLLPPLPARIKMDNSKKRDSEDFADSLRESGTKYEITYKDGSTGIFTGNNFYGSDQYVYNGINYYLSISRDEIIIGYIASDKAILEYSEPQGSFLLTDYGNFEKLNKVKKLEITPKKEIKLYEDQLSSYEYKNLFTAKVTWWAGTSDDVAPENLTIEYDDVRKTIIAKFADGANQQETSYDDFTILKPISISITEKKGHYNSSEAKYKLIDELGVTHEITGEELCSNYSAVKEETTDGKWCLKIPGKIQDVLGNTREYTSASFEDVFAGLTTEKTDSEEISLTQTKDTNWFTNGSINTWLTSNKIKFQYFFKDAEAITSETINAKGSNPSFTVTGTGENSNIKFIYSAYNELIPLDSPGPKEMQLKFTVNGKTYTLEKPVCLYAALPDKITKISNPASLRDGIYHYGNLKFIYGDYTVLIELDKFVEYIYYKNVTVWSKTGYPFKLEQYSLSGLKQYFSNSQMWIFIKELEFKCWNERKIIENYGEND